jgi:aspartyl-tRNA(Asn)/glutamyl-tRNA(Gln) amidotransferase subunit A
VEGVVPLAESMDHAGPLARSVVDICIMLEAVAGKYPRGATAPDYRKLRKSVPRRIRLGWPKQYFFERVDPEVRQTIDAAAKCFASMGARIEEVSLPHLAESVGPSTNIALAEATRYHESQGFFPARQEDYSDDMRKRLAMGREVRAVDYLNALTVQRETAREFQAAFEQVDAILAPAVPIVAPLLGEKELEIAGEMETVRSALVRMNRPANFTGDPAISIPCGFTSTGLPIGLQLIGPHWSEARLLAIALAYEDATEWHKRHPALN